MRLRLVLPLLIVAYAASPSSQRPSSPGVEAAAVLTGASHLAQAYDFILDAAFDDAARLLGGTCAPAPPEACRVLDAVALWWRIQIDPASDALDARFATTVDGAIASTGEWTVREPQRAEAWFYLGGAYAARAQWRVLRGARLAAARDGSRIKDALERAIALAPDLDDAQFGLGMYLYYADIAPAAAKFLRWLLLLPGGDRIDGLARMQRARSGVLLRGESAWQLQRIYLWYENRATDALALLEELRRDHPRNPLFWWSIAEVQDVYLHDLAASLQTYLALLQAATDGGVHAADVAAVEARLGAARLLDLLHESDRAVDLAGAVVAGHPARPEGATARAHVVLGLAYERLGESARARAAYQAAIATAPADDPHGSRAAARRGLRRPVDVESGDAYRQSLRGWRLLEAGEVDAATSTLRGAVARAPDDPVARHRYARALIAQGDVDAALREIGRALTQHAAAPAPIVARMYLDAGSLLERRGDRVRAARMYANAIDVFGGGAETTREARRALARLR